MSKSWKWCPRCDARLYRDRDDSYHCLVHGEQYIPVIPRRLARKEAERHMEPIMPSTPISRHEYRRWAEEGIRPMPKELPERRRRVAK